jgi:hypothetical protein
VRSSPATVLDHGIVGSAAASVPARGYSTVSKRALDRGLQAILPFPEGLYAVNRKYQRGESHRTCSRALFRRNFTPRSAFAMPPARAGGS